MTWRGRAARLADAGTAARRAPRVAYPGAHASAPRSATPGATRAGAPSLDRTAVNQRSAPPTDRDQLERELRALEKQALSAVSGFEGPFYNKAGDLCVEAGWIERSLGYYGLAIDSYLMAGRWDSAAAVCRKLLRVSPNAVRARCTLAWLSIGRGWAGEALRHLAEYVAAARRAGRERLAIHHLRLMGEATADPEILAALADHLTDLGDPEAAAAMADAIALGEELDEEGVPPPPEARWQQVLRAALMRPEELAGT